MTLTGHSRADLPNRLKQAPAMTTPMVAVKVRAASPVLLPQCVTLMVYTTVAL